MVNRAIELRGYALIDEHIKSASQGALGLTDQQALLDGPGRQVLATASKRGSWFKSVTLMEEATADILAPNLTRAEQDFQSILVSLFAWMR